jgi:putative transposase
VLRKFVAEGIYHIYNRGVEGTDIFREEQDYKMFLYYLYIYLVPLKVVLEHYPSLPFRLRVHNMSKEIDLLSYCLMPDHIHLLLQPHSQEAVPIFMKQVTNAYTQYFNQKYSRSGSLFQGRYKAAGVDKDKQFIHVSRHVHLHPLHSHLVTKLTDYLYSSLPDYLHPEKESICNRRLLQSFFSSPQKHLDFVLDQTDYNKKLPSIKSELIEANIG